MTTNTLHPFEQTDWYGYAGADKLPSGSEPLIRHMERGDIVVTGDGFGEVAIDVNCEDGIFGCSNFKSEELAKFIAENMREEDMTVARLKALGFQRY